MQITLGSFDTEMSQKFLDIFNINPFFEQMRGKTVS